MANIHQIVSGPQTGKTTAAVALVLGHLAQGLPAPYVAPSRDMARRVVSCRQLPGANVVGGMRQLQELDPLPAGITCVIDEAATFELVQVGPGRPMPAPLAYLAPRLQHDSLASVWVFSTGAAPSAGLARGR